MASKHHVRDLDRRQLATAYIVRLGRSAPVLQFSLATRKSEDESRQLAALRECLQEVPATAQRQRLASRM